MRLNLGCGKHYKDGFINIDAYDETVADAIMPVENLLFPSNTIDAIEADQLIEHLGYLRTKYALSEWFRVLKPGGNLRIETPDVQSAMKRYLEGDHGIRKETLTWLYGMESPGMQHRLCYPEILLKDLLKHTGFTHITTSFFTLEENHPVMRMTCKKQKAMSHQIVAECRKVLGKRHLVAFENSILAVEQEELLDVFQQSLSRYLNKNDEKILGRFLILGCIQSTPMTQALFQECLRYLNVSEKTKKNYTACIRFLSSIQFSDLLIVLLKETDPVAGTQKETIQTITEFGTQCIQKILTDSKGTERLKKTLTGLSQRCSCTEHAFFSGPYLEYLAADRCYTAIKYFLKKEYSPATAAFEEAIRYDRNHLLYYWNLGRVQMLRKLYPEATQYYQDALTLVRLSTAPSKKKVEAALSRERTHFSAQKHGLPILDVRR